MNLNLQPGNVKTAMKGAASRDLWQVPRDRIKVLPDFNVRTHNDEHKEHINMLAQSMMQNGYKQSKPMEGFVAEDNSIYLTDGHCRLEAFDVAVGLGAPMSTIPVVVTPKGTNMADLVVGLVTSNNGKPLAPIETAMVIKRLIGFGWDEKQISTRLAMGVPRINDLLSLAGADAEIQTMVANGDVSATTAINTIKKKKGAATAALRDGIQTAKRAGKKRATAKDMGPKKPSYRKVVEALLAWRKSSEWQVPDDLQPVLKLARESVAE